MRGRVFKRCSCPTRRDTAGRRINCRKDHGSWSYVHDAPDYGSRKRRQVMRGGFATAELAQEALTAALAAIARGEYVETGTSVPTVAEYLDDWLASKRNLRHSTRVCYRQHIDNHLAPLIGPTRLTDLRAHHIDRMLNTLTAGDPSTGRRPVSVAMSRRVFSTLRVALNAAVKKRMLAYSPCVGVELAPERPPEAAVWSAEQVGTFLDAAAGDRLAVLFRLVLTRGLRRGEAVGLRWRDVDFKAGLLHIRQAAVQVGSAVQLGPPKTKHGQRVVALDATTVVALKAHRKTQAAERLEWGPAYEDHDLVFARENGTIEKPDRVSRHFAAIATVAGLPVIKLHEGRHSAATLALEAGASMKEVQDLLGHSTYTLTADTYSHVSARVRSESAEKVARLITREQNVSSRAATADQVPDTAEGGNVSALVTGVTRRVWDSNPRRRANASAVFKSQEPVTGRADNCRSSTFQQVEHGPADLAVPRSDVPKRGLREQSVSNQPTDQ